MTPSDAKLTIILLCFTLWKASQNHKYIENNVSCSCLLHVTQGLGTMNLSVVDRALPTSTQRSPSSCSPVCRTLPANPHSDVSPCICGRGPEGRGPVRVISCGSVLPNRLPSSRWGSWPSAGWCSAGWPADRLVDAGMILPWQHWPDPPRPIWGAKFTL